MSNEAVCAAIRPSDELPDVSAVDQTVETLVADQSTMLMQVDVEVSAHGPFPGADDVVGAGAVLVDPVLDMLVPEIAQR